MYVWANLKKSFHVLFINLACLSSETNNLQRVFLRIYDAKGGSLFQAFLEETVKTGNKNRCVVETTHILRRKLKIKFRAFPKRVDPRILSLESFDYFGTSEHNWVVEKNKNLN